MARIFMSKSTMERFSSMSHINTLYNNAPKSASDPSMWGLCHDGKGGFVFRQTGNGWFLLISIEEISCVLDQTYDESYDFNKLILFFGIECSTPQNLHWEILDISSEDEILERELEFLEGITIRH